ncbi:hypothetical protein [Streptomyces sp. NPDC013181]|uniref:hypothetical protein n=1 Tax=Streptomyces sp. NPDC013181 TaxID=3364864 RepID=UPI0036AE0C9F
MRISTRRAIRSVGSVATATAALLGATMFAAPASSASASGGAYGSYTGRAIKCPYFTPTGAFYTCR